MRETLWAIGWSCKAAKFIDATKHFCKPYGTKAEAKTAALKEIRDGLERVENERQRLVMELAAVEALSTEE